VGRIGRPPTVGAPICPRHPRRVPLSARGSTKPLPDGRSDFRLWEPSVRPWRRSSVWLFRLFLSVLVLTGCVGTYTDYAVLDGVEGAPSDQEVVITGIHGACDRVRPAEVKETASEVRVRVPLAVQRGDCRSIGLSLRVEAELREPLGDRVVIDVERNERLAVIERQPS
jgi:hypothetical protein